MVADLVQPADLANHFLQYDLQLSLGDAEAQLIAFTNQSLGIQFAAFRIQPRGSGKSGFFTPPHVAEIHASDS